MKFRIPFTISSLERQKKSSKFFQRFIKPKKDTALEKYLSNTDAEIERKEYLAILLKNSIFAFIGTFIILSTALFFLNIENLFLISISLSLLLALFLFSTQRLYPKVFDSRRQKNIENNLIPALEDILVQLNSGIPLFNILINISSADYSELSKEFKKAVKEINAGRPQIEVIENLGNSNNSEYFKRTLWQIGNALRAGSDLSVVIEDSVRSLNQEQLIQIQRYGNKLNPLIMFYMLVTVIIPSLSIVFLTIISSLIGLSSTMTNTLFIALFVFVMIVQVTFLGMIRSIRPSLL